MLVNNTLKIEAEQFMKLRQQIPVVDVRTPAEFEKAHIPGAINIPLFSNEQRVVIGTIYKQEGKEAAILKGLDFVGPVMSRIVRDAKTAAKNNQLLVHCWRGGMRSESVAWLLQFSGLEVQVLMGGYKAYRGNVIKTISNRSNYMVVGGMTGSGKTDILRELKNKGEQVIDLEGLANHKGSVFGGIGQPDQPSTEMFENLLAEEILTLDNKKICWIEDESSNIGTVRLPQAFWAIKIKSAIVEVKVNREARISRLVNEYGHQDKDELKAAILRITKRLGHERTQKSIEALMEGDVKEVANITLDYYDKGYRNAMNREHKHRQHFVCEHQGAFNAEIMADQLLLMSRKLI